MSGEDEAEEVLGSRGRVKLLRALVSLQRRGQLASLSRLKSATHLKDHSLERHIEVLMRHGWVEEVQTPEGRRYRLKEGGKVEILKRLFRELSYA